MKKTKYLLLLMCAFLLTGCVKMNASMKINKDKSMDYEVIIAMNKQLVGDTNQVLTDDQIKKAKKNGYKLSDYKDEEMKGYKIVKHIKNIDNVSTTKKVESNIDVDSNDKYMFTVKKGFFKNTYKAVFKTNSTNNLNSQLSGSSDDNEIKEDDENYDDDYYDEDEDYDDDYYSEDEDYDDEYYDESDSDDEYADGNDDDTLDLSDNTDYSSYMENMDFTFEIKLPYKAKKNNATTVSKNGKTLSWNLLKHQDDIEFEFELYNLTNIYLTVGGAIVLIVLIVLFILKKKKKS